MTNYNDGLWHGWNGGECPVHPESTVDAVFIDAVCKNRYAGDLCWRERHFPIIAFRVTKEHKEPREFWIGELSGDVYKTKEALCIHVREVIE